ncbi:MAG: HNH endonuclease [Oleibacter sp.]|nr:HNH endonuclease [Thalassolituus sp.]
MKNNKLQYYFHTLSGSFELSVEAHNKESSAALYELHSIFFEIEGNWFVYDDSNIHYVTMKMKEELRLYTNKYRQIVPQINQLNAKISHMNCGEGFALLPVKPVSTIDRLRVEAAVLESNLPNRKSTGDDFSSDDIGDDFFSDDIGKFRLQIQGYNFFSPRVDVKTKIGPSRRQDRKCRFCGGTSQTGAKFKKKAHAIPESIGNKNIICNEECDACNEFFGVTYEKSLVEYFNIYRVIDGVKSKEGYPRISYQNGYAFHSNGVAQVYSEDIIEDEHGNVQIKLKSNEYFNENYFYKSLCKMALSVIDVNELPSLQRTLKWLMDKYEAGVDLPLVGMLISPAGYESEPKIIIINRVDDSLSSPHVLCELRVGYYKFLFILPYSDKDELKYSSKNEMEELFKVFPQFSTDVGWIYKKFSVNKMVKPVFAVNLNNSQVEP